MKHTTFTALALLVVAFAGSAQAQGIRVVERVEGSVELALSDLTLPADESGRVQYKACATCTVMTHSVSSDTVYRFNGQPLSLADFLVAVKEIRETPSVENRAMAAVFYDLNTKHTTRVIVHVSRAQERQ